MSNEARGTAVTNDGELALTPKLRFPEFRDAAGWEEKALKDLAQINPPNRGLPESFVYIDLESVEAGELKAKTTIARDGAPSRAQRLLERGDIIFQVVRPYQRNNLLCDFEDDEDYVASTGYAQIRAHASERFLFQSIHTDTFVNRVIEKCTGSNYPAINSSDLADIHLGIPPTFSEQQKIAGCLISVDELIAAQTRKVTALKIQKKGLMQQLFPREGETQPRLRFPEFQDAGEWTETTVGEISDVLMCKRVFAEETNPSRGVPFYKIGTLGGVPDAFISREKFDDYKSRYNYPRKGEVLITCSGTVGKCLPYDGRDAYFQDSNIVWLDNPKGEVSNDFLFVILSNVNWAKLNSTTITRIYSPDLRGLSIKFPEDEAEQRRIADCFAALDDLIAAYTQKLEVLKTHKKGLMQQLFPSMEDA